jgi:hypothetical protein
MMDWRCNREPDEQIQSRATQTKTSAHVVIRNEAGKKLFDLYVTGISITVAVPMDAEIKMKERASDKRIPQTENV